MRSLLFAAVSNLALAGAVQAQSGPADPNSPTDVDPIVVTGQARGYLALDTVTATKTETPLLDVPGDVWAKPGTDRHRNRPQAALTICRICVFQFP